MPNAIPLDVAATCRSVVCPTGNRCMHMRGGGDRARICDLVVVVRIVVAVMGIARYICMSGTGCGVGLMWVLAVGRSLVGCVLYAPVQCLNIIVLLPSIVLLYCVLRLIRV